MLKRIITGGQTGVDRAALDAALDRNFPCGGYCPKGRIAEDGIIDAKYPLEELASKNYARRTLENVLFGDGTLIIYKHELQGGTALTARLCKDHNKPYMLMDAQQNDVALATKKALSFINDYKIKLLNVAGPRSSQWPAGYQHTYQRIKLILENFL